jgi:hypothetical protein
VPNTSFSLGNNMFSRFPSFVTFLLPIFKHQIMWSHLNPPLICQLEQSGEKGKRKHTWSARIADLTLPLKHSNSCNNVRDQLY